MDILKELSIAMRLRAIKHDVISSNIANINTPNYRCKNLDFEKEFNKILTPDSKLKLETTNSKHISLSNKSSGLNSVKIEECNSTVIGNDNNNVDLDREMAKMAKNQLLYNSYIQIFTKKVRMLKDSITQGGK